MADDILSRLPIAKWRGLPAPQEDASYEGAHGQAARSYPYVDGEGHDWVGMMSYRLSQQRFHFLTTIKPGDWYPQKWNSFRAALENGAPGDYEHPDLGVVRCVVNSWKVALKASNRGGVVVDVDFSQTVENLDERVVFLGPEVSLPALALQADSTMALLGLTYPDGESSSSFTDLVGQVEGFLLSTQMTVQGTITRAQGLVSQVFKEAQDLDDHAAWILRDTLMQLWGALKQQAQQIVQVARATSRLTTNASTTLDQLSRELGNPLIDLISLNLHLVGSPSVPRGAVVQFYTNGVSISSPLKPPGL